MNGYHYPKGKHRRKHGPQGYLSTGEFREWLRDEFAFRCVYCLEREQWVNCLGHFHIEHFKPTAANPEAVLNYDNLLYSCHVCNLVKGSQVVPDPLSIFTANTVTVYRSGRVQGKTKESRRLIELLQLNSPGTRKRRRLMIEILAAAAKVNPVLHAELLGFPENLPDLARLRPPGGNKRPAGIKRSYLMLQKTGRLPKTY